MKYKVDKYTKPNFTQSALITIDVQNDFTLDNAPVFIQGTKEVIPNIAALLNAYRAKRLLIIHVIRLYFRDGSNADLCRRLDIEEGQEIVIPESDGAELVHDLKPNNTIMQHPNDLLLGEFQQIGDNEYLMYKPRWGAFYRTKLEEFLKECQIDTIIFSGCNFPNCPRTSIYEASERDFRVVLATNAISQLYKKGEEELNNIGVSLFTANEIEELLA